MQYISPHTGVCLGAGLANWETDRLYESGMGESFLVLGRSMSLHQLGQWAALGAMTAGLLALALVASAMQENVRIAAISRRRLLTLQGACLSIWSTHPEPLCAATGHGEEGAALAQGAQ